MISEWTLTFTNLQRALVLDYLCHSCYTKTASAFNKDSTVRPLDADGDEIIDDTVSDADRSAGSYSEERFQTLLQQVRLRQGALPYLDSAGCPTNA